MKQADRVILKKIVSYCDDITDMVMELDNESEAFEQQKTYQYAVSMCILQIGELVAKLSDEGTSMLPEVPWRAIRGMRNIYAHNYERTKLSTLWQTVTEDIPKLREQLQSVL